MSVPDYLEYLKHYFIQKDLKMDIFNQRKLIHFLLYVDKDIPINNIMIGDLEH